jgi:hypothetical protein
MAGTITAASLDSGASATAPLFKANGTQIGTLCRAWVNFNGEGTVAIRASFNVSSITDNGTGDYTVNFTNAMPDANYSGCVNGMEFSTGTADWFFSPKRDSSYGTTFQTGSFRVTATGDAGAVVVAIFR